MVAPLSPETRAATLVRLSSVELDLLIIGGGITGAGVARDAALRGLTVGLVERTDFAAGTSSRSSKLIHGGVRYLQQGDLGLVREAAAERCVLRDIAPHLTIPLRMVMPTYGRAMQAKLAVGLWTFEKVASVPADERHQMWGREETLTEEPTLAGEKLYGAATFTEYLTDDARLVLDNVKGAHQAGALCVNHAEAIALVPEGEGTRVSVRDTLSGTTYTTAARIVVNAAGPWVDAVRGLAGEAAGRRLHLTKGIHVVVPHERLPVRHIVVMQARDRRSVFAVPRLGMTYLGTTDTDYPAPAEYPEITAGDVDYLLEAANRTFTGLPLRREEIVAAWAGLRPLLHEEGKSPSEISRRDEIMTGTGGLISIAGGKLTTFRRMAERVVDLVCERLGKRAAPCRTATVALPGGEFTPEELVLLPGTLRNRLPRLLPGGAERLVRLYGGTVEAIARRAEADPAEGELVRGLPGVVRAEIAHTIDQEMALTLEDILERRSRLLLFDPRQGVEGVEGVAEIAAARLGWDARRTANEIDAYRRLAASQRSVA
jgi:glycerol-3-phosphate dehydrogenase